MRYSSSVHREQKEEKARGYQPDTDNHQGVGWDRTMFFFPAYLYRV